MADIEKIKGRIAELAARRKNVSDSEIEWVTNQLKQNGFSVRRRKTTHGILYGLTAAAGSVRFSVCPHHSGRKQLNPEYVDAFINAMITLGLYEE
jgi:hypothetical protein